MASGLELMKITGYEDGDFQKAFRSSPYTVMINPENIKWDRRIEYNQQQIPDSSSTSQKYKNTPSEQLSFDIIIDCTGIVDAKRTSMATELENLQKIVYQYNGGIHRPNFVKVQWGKDLVFKGVLMSINTSFTLFRPDGSPIRAKVSMSFTQYISPTTVAKKDQKKSPDVTHVVNVVEGMTLPQLCSNVWSNDQYYIQVARFNNLNKFRNLKGITHLIFPPIQQPV